MTSAKIPASPDEVDHGRTDVARAARAATAVLIGLIMLQAALAAGAPLGRAAWGGTHTTLPTSLRIATAAPIAIYALAALVLLRQAGHPVGGLSASLARRGSWMVAAIFGASALVNLTSGSGWERFLMGPLALALAALSVLIARAPEPE